MKNPWDMAVVVGVPGVGKTSLSKKVSEILGYEHVNYGDLMLEIARSRELAYSDPQMFSLDIDVQHKIWEDTAFKIKRMNNVIVDMHGVDPSQMGYILSLPVEILSPDIILIIESSAENVLERRNVDKFKPRIEENIKNIHERMDILRMSMTACSALLGCNFIILKNDIFDECLEKMINILGKGR